MSGVVTNPLDVRAQIATRADSLRRNREERVMPSSNWTVFGKLPRKPKIDNTFAYILCLICVYADTATEKESTVPDSVDWERAAVSRREMLAGGLGLASVAALTACTSKSAKAVVATHTSSHAPATKPAADQPAVASTDLVAFQGETQAGITTSAQGYLVFAALDLTDVGPAELRNLLDRWTHAAAAL